MDSLLLAVLFGGLLQGCPPSQVVILNLVVLGRVLLNELRGFLVVSLLCSVSFEVSRTISVA